MWLLNKLICITLFSIIACQTQSQSPNIIIIVADDLGWNDVGFHGSTQIPTPNIDALAFSGVILNKYYVQPICTPSRGALLSGLHPIHTGLNHDVIYGPQPYSLPLNIKVLPQYLSDFGYISHAVGKWHIGMAYKEMTPIYRGFSSHYGYWNGHTDYYDHTSMEGPGYWGYDFRRNMSIAHEAYGKYTTDLLTDEAIEIIKRHEKSNPLFLYLAHLAVHSANPYAPLQAPMDIINKFSYIKDKGRRKFAAMLWKLDESVGRVTSSLKKKEMLSNSIIIFTTDNGGPAAGFNMNAASNWPLRGVKASMWEGGVRGAGFIWSPLLKNPGRVSTHMMQITDWLPTLYSAAGGNGSQLHSLDGRDQWNTLVNDGVSPRNQILHNIDPIMGGASVRVGQWKLLYKPSGFGPHWDGWFGPSGRNRKAIYSTHKVRTSLAGIAVRSTNATLLKNINTLRIKAEILCAPVPKNATKSCNTASDPCLFHITSDPCEYYDLSSQYPDKVKLLMGVLENYNATSLPPANLPWDPAANPKFWGYVWTHWKDFGAKM